MLPTGRQRTWNLAQLILFADTKCVICEDNIKVKKSVMLYKNLLQNIVLLYSFYMEWKPEPCMDWDKGGSIHICTLFVISIHNTCISKRRFDMNKSLYAPELQHVSVKPPCPAASEYTSHVFKLFILCHLQSDPNPMTYFDNVLFQRKLKLLFKVIFL
jgi:hypothetical protein